MTYDVSECFRGFSGNKSKNKTISSRRSNPVEVPDLCSDFRDNILASPDFPDIGDQNLAFPDLYDHDDPIATEAEVMRPKHCDSYLVFPDSRDQELPFPDFR